MAQLGGVGFAWRLALVAAAVLLACVHQASGAKGALSASAFDYESERAQRDGPGPRAHGDTAWCGQMDLLVPGTELQLSACNSPTALPRPCPLAACFACELTWRQVHVSVPLNPSAEDVNAAFDEFCANPVPVFEASCRDMAAQRWKMVDDYLAGKSFNSICENAQVCWKGLMLSGA